MRARLVLDATPLIHLCKAGLGRIIEDVDGEKFTVPAVFDEVVTKGRELGYEDSSVAESLIERRVLSVKAASKAIARGRGLHRGEVEVISLAKELSGVAVLDDAVARSVARLHDVRVEGTYGMILRSLAEGLISRGDAEEALEKLVASGWRCDVELYAKLLKIAREFGK